MQQRYFLKLAYNGKNYCGWQIQPNAIAVQQILQQAISTILRQPIDIVGAGRTDAGVHAKEMVAHFDTSLPISDTNKFLANLNSLLPADIAVYNLKAVAPDAHARFDATARTYQYWVITQKSPFYSQSACKVNHDLDFNLMNQAAQTLFDYQDFTSFSKLHTDVKTNNCTMMYAKWHQEGDKWIFTIKANRFLRNMVRSIVGTLFEVGKGKLSIEQFREVIEAKNRCAAGHSVPAQALYLSAIDYPESVVVFD